MSNLIKPVSFETELAIEQISSGIQQARLLRGDTQRQAAERLGVSLPTIKRLESGDPDVVGSIALSTVLSALVLYGHERDVLSLGDPARDARSQELIQKTLPQRIRRKVT